MADGVKLATAYYELIAATPGAESQISSAILPAASKTGDAAGKSIGSKILGGIKSNAGLIAGALGGITVGKGLKDSVDAFVSLNSETKGLQRIIGGTTAEVSGLSGAMKLSGMDTSKSTTSLTIFSKKLQAVQGNSEATAAMQDLLGTSITNADGSIRSMSEILPGVADKFASMPDGVEKTALATQLFGKSGTAMLPFLNKGANGIDELTEKAKSLGIVLDDSSAQKFSDYKGAMRTLQTTMQGLKVTVGGAVIPVITKLAEFMTSAITPAIQNVISAIQNSSGIQSTISSIMDSVVSIGTAIGNFAGAIAAAALPTLGVVLQGIASALQVVGNWMASNMDLVLSLGAAIAAIVATIKIATVVQAAFNLVMSANPIMLVITAIAALVAGLVYFFTQTETGRAIWASFTSWLSSVWDSVSSAWNSAWTAITSFLSGVWNGAVSFAEGIWNGLISWITGIPGRFMDGLSALGQLGSLLGGYVQAGKDAIVSKFNEVVSWVGGIPGRILGALGDLGSLLSDAGRQIISGLWTGLREEFEEVKSWVGGIGSWIADHKGPKAYDLKLLVPNGGWIMQGLNEGLSGGFGDVLDNVSGMGSRLRDEISGTTVRASSVVGVNSVPAYAAGSLASSQVGGNETTASLSDDQVERLARAFETGSTRVAHAWAN